MIVLVVRCDRCGATSPAFVDTVAALPRVERLAELLAQRARDAAWFVAHDGAALCRTCRPLPGERQTVKR